MKAKKKRAKTPKTRALFMRHVLAQNVRGLADLHFKEGRNKPLAIQQAAKKAGYTLSLSSAQRILAEETGATLDNIQALSEVFDVSVYQLLIPELQLRNPQVVQGATQGEERLYRRWRQARSDRQPTKEDA